LLLASATTVGICCRHQQQRWEFAAGVNNNGGNLLPASKTTADFAAGVNNNSKNMLPASTTMVGLCCRRQQQR
jgi:hypothetical protein